MQKVSGSAADSGGHPFLKKSAPEDPAAFQIGRVLQAVLSSPKPEPVDLPIYLPVTVEHKYSGPPFKGLVKRKKPPHEKNHFFFSLLILNISPTNLY